MKRRIKSRSGVRIIIVGLSLIFRRGLRSVLEEQRGFRVVGEAVGCADAAKLVRKLKPDILMLDFDMSRQSALAVLRKLAGLGLPTRIIVLASQVDRSRILEALQLGARGIVEKNGMLKHKIKAIRAVNGNEFWAKKEIIADVLGYLGKMGGAHPPAKEDAFGLTLREREILPAVAVGRSNKDIAQEFSISEETLKHHLTHIYDKLGVSNRLELALFAINHSLVALDLPMSASAIA